MALPSTSTCAGVGTCVLHKGHGGLCVYQRHDPDAHPATMPAGEAQVGLRGGDVIVDFGITGPWQWVAFTPAEALHFAETLIKSANLARAERAH